MGAEILSLEIIILSVLLLNRLTVRLDQQPWGSLPWVV